MTDTSKEACKHQWKVYRSRLACSHRTQYIRCKLCGALDKRLVGNELSLRIDELEARLKNLEESIKHSAPIGNK